MIFNINILSILCKICQTTCFVIFLVFNFYVRAQSVDETIKLADELTKIGDYKQALQLYKRANFFSDEHKHVTYIKSADCYYFMKD